MINHDTTLKRQEYNFKILEKIEADWMTSELFDHITELIYTYPDQRWGQLITNYVTPDYRSNNVSKLTIEIFKYFEWDYDPFHEESKKTYNQLIERLGNGLDIH